ncbi:Long-chain-alcohol oxidase FAO4A [Morella rubra]|uniref:Long-chain-alcohol oxidase n=1 Tax=Morella rubra TaxID=262757 RepID=A0A6A1V5F8_9ROSI|nr:Long-chain-alcohol oxidase FAO4A [Morella rubra]
MEPNGARDVRVISDQVNGHKELAVDLGEAHNLLMKGRDHRGVYVNSLSSWEMESLTALCDTYLPSLDLSDVTTDESTVKFYGTSASMAGTPERVGALMCERLEHPRKWMTRVALFLLSTWMGTFILCGRASLSSQFPYFQRFALVPRPIREEIVLSWSLSFIRSLRMLFRATKLLTLYVFYTQVDEKDENISWKAIGYVGPDPRFKTQTPQLNRLQTVCGENEQGKDVGAEELFGPLYRGLVDLKIPRDVAANALRGCGFPVSVIPQKTAPSSLPQPSLVIKCDAVVIGSGSGGGVVAGVLAQAGYKVLVLEKGDYCARNNLSLLEGPAMDQMYLSSGLVATDDTQVLILAGSTVGGGSTVNWSASIRTPERVIKDWSDGHELELFDSALYKEAMDVVCEKMGVQSEFHNEGFNNAILRRGCQELGYPMTNIPRNAPADHYCGWCCLGCKDGRKKGTAETWLVDLVSSGNGAILPGCEAIKILNEERKGRDRKTATGVVFEFEHKEAKDVCLVESKVTIVACGALCTPALLRRSGLKNANIGRNLHLHPVAMSWGYFPDTPSSDAWPEAEKKSYEGGIMTVMSTVVDNHDGSGYGAVIQTPSLHPGTFSILTPWLSGIDMKNRMRRFSRTAHIFALARDKGSGTVLSPSIISYRMGDVDRESLKKGLEKALRILAAAGAEEIGTHHCKGKTLNVKKASSHEFERLAQLILPSSEQYRDFQPLNSFRPTSIGTGLGGEDGVYRELGLRKFGLQVLNRRA